MALIDPGDLMRIRLLHRLRRLRGTEVAAVGKNGHQISEDRIVEFRFVTGERPEMARPVKPRFRVNQDVHQIHRPHLFPHHLIDRRQIVGRRLTIEFPQDRLAVLYAQTFILRQCDIDFSRRFAQPFV
jgi:hypothetical protein